MTKVALQFTKIHIWTEKENQPQKCGQEQKSGSSLEWKIEERMMRGNWED